jgi:thiamine pyrophosphate-dependent acetolactate synthase large subunit-like protein
MTYDKQKGDRSNFAGEKETCPHLRMQFVPALEVLVKLRREEIVVTTMGSAREWPKLSQHPLDLHYIPSAMGQAPDLGLGLALAQPQREVIVLNGDGCMLINLGCLVTIVASGAKNLTLIVFDNGIYEVTGGQRTAAATVPATKVDFAGMAKAAGFASVAAFDSLDAWQQQAGDVLRKPGPRFVVLSVEPVGAAYQLESPGPLAQRLARFQEALSE